MIGLFPIASVLRQEPQITLTAQAELVRKALDEIGPLIHKKLKASAVLADDVVCFRFVDVPASEVLRRIAGVEDGTWKDEAGGVSRLIRTPKQAKAEDDLERSRMVASLEPAIKKISDGLDKRTAWTAEVADKTAKQMAAMVQSKEADQTRAWSSRLAELTSQTPLTVALNRMIVELGVKQIADLSPTLRTVWSTHPNRSQKAFPRELSAILNEAIADQELWMRAVDDNHVSRPDWINSKWGAELGDLQNRQERTWSTVHLTANPRGGGPDFNFLLTAYDSRGRNIAQAQIGISTEFPVEKALVDLMPKAPEKIDTTSWPKPGGDVSGRLRRSPLDPTFLADLLKPEVVDPLSLSGSPFLVQLAEKNSLNMTARLSDELFTDCLMLLWPRPPRPELLFTSDRIGCTFEVKDGWLVGKPIWPSLAHGLQSDRRALGNLIRRMNSENGLSVEEESDLTSPLPSRSETDLIWSEITLLNQPATRFFGSLGLRFYSKVSPQQRLAMEDGVRVSSLNEAERSILQQMVFGGDGQIQYSPSNTPDASLYETGILSEPTQAFPDGLPGDGIVRISTSIAPVLFLPSDDPSGHGRELLPREFALGRFIKDHPGPRASPAQNLDDLIAGRREQVTISVQLTPILSLSTTLNGTAVSDLHRITFDQMPSDFKAEFDKWYAEDLKTWPAAGARKPGGGTVPPQ